MGIKLENKYWWLLMTYNKLIMGKVIIKPYNVVDQTDLPEITVDQIPTDGDPLEVDKPVIGVIPLVVRDPSKVLNIEKYIQCLSIAHRKVKFRNEKGFCDLKDCDEMIISK
jgi:hypothetical protein